MFNDCKKLVTVGRMLVCALLLVCLVLDGGDVWGASSRSRRPRRDAAARARQERMEKAEAEKEAAENGGNEQKDEGTGDDDDAEEGEVKTTERRWPKVEPKDGERKPVQRPVRQPVKDELVVDTVKPEKALSVADFRVYGYCPQPADFGKSKSEYLTDVIYFKAKIDEKANLLFSAASAKAVDRLVKLGKSKGFKVYVCIGGWKTADIQKVYGTVMTSDKLRIKLIKEIVAFVKKHRLDGFNLDWEYPETKEQTKGYSEFIDALSRALRKHDKTLGTAVMQKKAMLLKRGFNQDAVMVMTYDFAPVNSPLNKVQDSINFWLSLMKKNRVPGAEGRLVMGLPFYGRSLKKWSTSKRYGTIVKENPDIKPNVDQVGDFAFTGIDSMRERVAWAIDKNLKGVMIWQLAQDSHGEKSLLTAIYKEIMLKKGVPDLNLDGMVSRADLFIMRRNWLKETDPKADKDKAWQMGDLNLDGKVDGKDVGIIKKSWRDGSKALKIVGKSR